jgi:ribulose-5-phosphate 4-epimerase/fuculose-1-phosphate aldolase
MEAQDLRIQVAWACRILAMGGHGDFTLGHVSARGPGDSIFMKRSGLGLNEITPDDVLAIDSTGIKQEGAGQVHREVVIHTEVYRARPDVGSVVHTHPPYSIALGASDACLTLLGHDAALFKDGIGVFDESADLITRPEQGQAVSRALGSRRAVLLRNHGVVVVGKDIPWATISALTLERAATIQAIAVSFGGLQPMTLEMAERLHPDKYPDDYMGNYWQYLIRELRRQRFDRGMPEAAQS